MMAADRIATCATEPARVDRAPDLTGAEVAAIARAGGSALIEIWAPWCLYGLLLASRTNELARRLAGRVRVGRMVLEPSTDVTALLGVRWIPALVYFRDGRVVRRWYGADVDIVEVEQTVLRRGQEEER
jgi:thioredoxin 1